MFHVRERCSLSFPCPEDFRSPANSDVQVAPIPQRTFPGTATQSPTPQGWFLTCFWHPATSPQDWLKSCLCCGGPWIGDSSAAPRSGLAWQAPVSPPPICHCRNELPDVKTCSDLPVACSPDAHFSLQLSPVVVVAVSLEEHRRCHHPCMKTKLTLCYISSLLTWNSTVSFLADK